MNVEIECPFAGPLFAVGYIFLQTVPKCIETVTEGDYGEG